MIEQLQKKGVTILNPTSVFIDSNVNPDLIHPDCVIHPCSRISGPETAIGPGCIIGAENPATVSNCQLEKNVCLKGGFFANSTFLDGVTCGNSAHIRPDCLLEEQASCAHCVGLKQTMLMPYVTLGSLINFCDCLMTGGTDRKNHSEVGSSFIHFNFTTRQDKATPSIMGNVPQGVMLDQPPIFLGGQGGLVGPLRIAFGTVTAAGSVCRRDITEPGKLVVDVMKRKGVYDYHPHMSQDTERIIKNNIYFIANLQALLEWYRNVRVLFMTSNPFSKACLTGGIEKIENMIRERRLRLTQVTDKSIPEIPPNSDCTDQRDLFIEEFVKYKRDSYLETITELPSNQKKQGAMWLNSVVASTEKALALS